MSHGYNLSAKLIQSAAIHDLKRESGKEPHSQTSQSVRYLSLSLPPWRPAEKQKPCQRQVYLPAPRNSLSIEMYVVTLGFGTHRGGASLSLFGSRNFCILGFLVNGAWRSNPFFYADNLSSVWFSYFLYPCIPFSPVPIGSHRGGALFSLFWISSFLFLPSHPMVLCSSWVGAQTLARRTRSANSVCIFYFLVDSIQCMERGASFSVWCLSFLYPGNPLLFNVVLASIGAGLLFLCLVLIVFVSLQSPSVQCCFGIHWGVVCRRLGPRPQTPV